MSRRAGWLLFAAVVTLSGVACGVWAAQYLPWVGQADVVQTVAAGFVGGFAGLCVATLIYSLTIDAQRRVRYVGGRRNPEHLDLDDVLRMAELWDNDQWARIDHAVNGSGRGRAR